MKRLLFIAHRVPYPPDKGERIRAYHEIRVLSRHFRVTLAAPALEPSDADNAGQLGRWCEDVLTAPAGGPAGLLRGAALAAAGRSVSEGYFRSRLLARRVAACRPLDLAMGYCSTMLPYLRRAPATRRVLDLVDVDSAKWSHYAERSAWPASWLYRREARAVGALERRALAECDAVFLVSSAEAEALPARDGRVLPVDNGVDAEHFRPDAAERVERADLVCTGTMSYRPNVDGVRWFVREVWPGVRRCFPEAVLAVVGRDPSPAAQKLAETPGVRVTGAVDDVRPYLAGASAAICPLRMARGVQNKVLEAMAMERAVVASPAALEGLDVEPGRDVLPADRPEEWVAEIASLLEDADRRRSFGRAARRRVLERYDWEACLRPMTELCLSLAEEGAAEGRA